MDAESAALIGDRIAAGLFVFEDHAGVPVGGDLLDLGVVGEVDDADKLAVGGEATAPPIADPCEEDIDGMLLAAFTESFAAWRCNGID